MDSDVLKKIDAYVDAHFDDYVEELRTLCAQPSVSAQGVGIDECAELVKGMLEKRGISAEIHPTTGHPIVYGEKVGKHDRTMLFYLHYDVQPPDPLEDWISPPWELTERDGALYARGVQDDKGHIVTRLAALDALHAVTGEYPCNVKLVIEGEEEIGSPSIKGYLEKEQARLAADACIWEFGGVNGNGNPVVALGVRGIIFVHLTVKTADADIHSGFGGSIVPNAAWRLNWALSTLKDMDERVQIDGFYDDVLPASEVDMHLLALLPEQAHTWGKLYGVKGFVKGLTKGVELRRAAVFDPTCNICGITAGYQGGGSKTIVPAEATAKLDFRLVPNQRPADIFDKLRTHLDEHGFDDIEMKLTGGYPPAKIDPHDPFVRVTWESAEEVFQKQALLDPIVGASGPMAHFVDYLDLPIVTTGAGYPGAKVHAPNEHLIIDNFQKAIKHTARIIGRFAELD